MTVFYSRFVINDFHRRLVHGALGQTSDIQVHGQSFCPQPDEVVLLISKDWDSHDWHGVIDGLVNAVQTTVGNESSCLGVACK